MQKKSVLPVLFAGLLAAVPAMAQGTSPVVINEFLASNQNGDRDQAGEADDWIELHNTTNQAYDLAGHYLSDSTLKRKWKFPLNSVVPAHGFLRVWADNQPTQGPLHATFRLDKLGEQVALFDIDTRGNTLLDSITFGLQKVDRSYGRIPDGGQEFFFIWTPSGNKPLTGTGLGQAIRFDKRRTGAPSGFDLKSSGTPQVLRAFVFNLVGGKANSAAILAFSLKGSYVDLGAFGPLMLDSSTMIPVFLPLDAAGDANLSGQVPTSLKGFSFYAQAASTELSNALVVRVSQ